MKLVEKIKKGLIGMGIFILTIPTKVFAKVVVPNPGIQTDYGVRTPNPIFMIWDIARIFLIPITLLIGLIIYFKKSKSNTKKRVLVIIGIIVITVIVYFVVNNIIDQLDRY